MSQLNFKKPRYKIEVARLLGCSIETLRRDLNEKYYERLKKETGYSKDQKRLTAKQLNWLQDEIGLTPEI